MSGERPHVLLEVCVDGPDGLAAAVQGGADRVEVCAALELGGLTPSPGLMAQARVCGVPAVAMIRPRAGSFAWTPREVAVMEAEVAAVRQAGLAGVVIGASLPDGRLDEPTLRRLGEAAAGLEVALNRCIDLAPQRADALEAAIRLNVNRVLTSAGAARAVDDLDEMERMHRWAAGRLSVMPGSGLTAGNVGALLAAALFREVHASCSREVAQEPRLVAMGFAPPVRRETDADLVRALRAALDAL